MKKLFILSLLFIALPVYAAPWDTVGNVVTSTDKIGSTNSQDVSFIRGNIEKIRLTTDGLRFMSPLSHISDSNGQVFMNHLTNGGTAIYGFLGTRMVNLTANGVEIIGPLIAKSNYTIAPNTAYTLTATDETVEMESGDFILPDATPTNKGKRYELINTGDGQIPVQSNSGQMIGNNVQEAQYIIMPGGSVVLKSNGSTWRVVANKI